MGTPTMVEHPHGKAMGTGSLSIDTASTTAVGDLLVGIHMADYYAASGMASPGGTAGTWSQIVTGDVATNDVHVRAWRRFVTTGGVQTVQFNPIVDEDLLAWVLVIRDSDSTTPVDGTPASNTGTATTTMAAPAVSPASPDALMICAWISGNGDFTGFPPGTMSSAGSEDGAPFCEGAVAYQALSASGSTGTRTVGFSTNRNFAAISFAIQGVAAAAAGRPTILVPSLAAVNRAGRW